MKVVTSCKSRFHIFDQARELQSHGLLYKLITDYPKIKTREFGIKDENVISLLPLGLINHFLVKFNISIFNYYVHRIFSFFLQFYVSEKVDVFITLSSFGYDTIKRCKKNGVLSIVDHGSIDQSIETEILKKELSQRGVTDNSLVANSIWNIELQKSEFNMTDYVMAVSEFAKSTMVEAGLPASKIYVNHPGVDLSSFYPGDKCDDVFRVIQVGTVSYNKGVQYLMDAFVEANINNSELLFVGRENSCPIIEEYKNKYSDKSNIKFIGHVKQKELRNLYINSSISVLPSLADGFGMVVPQSLACGTPVIVSNNTGAKDIIVNGENGFVLDTANTKVLASKLIEVSSNKVLLQKLKENSSKNLDSLSWQSYGNRLVKILKDIQK